MFAAAKREAEALAELVEAGGHVHHKLETVSDACRDYAKACPDAGHRFRRYVYDDSIAKVKLDKLRRRHVKEWCERLEAQPALVSRRKGASRSIASVRLQLSTGIWLYCGRRWARIVVSPGAPNSGAA